MRISFHEDPVVVTNLCQDLRDHGAVYWHTVRPNFARVAEEVEQRGLEVIPLCARAGGDFMNFLVRADLADEVQLVEALAAAAIVRWQALGEPVPHLEAI